MMMFVSKWSVLFTSCKYACHIRAAFWWCSLASGMIFSM